MFTKMKNIDSAFRYVRLFSLVVIICSLAVAAFSLYKSFSLVSQMQGKIYILANGKAIEAFAADRKDNIPVEARDHVKAFHKFFFTLDPDENVIRTNINKALNLADGTAKRVYDDLKEKGYYAGIISGNISQGIEVDSVQVDIKGYPYHFRCYATQQITRATTTVTRSLITEGALRNVSRSDNNPHGFLIEHWTTIENRDIATENRK